MMANDEEMMSSIILLIFDQEYWGNSWKYLRILKKKLKMWKNDLVSLFGLVQLNSITHIMIYY